MIDACKPIRILLNIRILSNASRECLVILLKRLSFLGRGQSSLDTSSITTPQDAHKLVLQVAEWFTASLSWLGRHKLTT